MNFADLRVQFDTNMQVFGTVGQIWPSEFNRNGKKKQNCQAVDDAGETQKITVYLGSNPDMDPRIHTNQRLEFDISARVGSGIHTGKIFYGGFWKCANPQQNQVPPQGYQPPPQQVPYQAPNQKAQGYNLPVPPHQMPTATKLGMPQQTAQQYAAALAFDNRHEPEEPSRGPVFGTREATVYSSTYAYEPTPESQRAMRRNIALECATRSLVGRQLENSVFQDTLNLANDYTHWLATGEMPMKEDEDPTEGNGVADEFENFQSPGR